MWIGECCINTNPCRSAWDIDTRNAMVALVPAQRSSLWRSMEHRCPSSYVPQHYQVITVECMQEPHDSGVKFYYTSDDCDYYTQANNSKGKQRQWNRHTHNVHPQHPFIPINTANKLLHLVKIPESMGAATLYRNGRFQFSATSLSELKRFARTRAWLDEESIPKACVMDEALSFASTNLRSSSQSSTRIWDANDEPCIKSEEGIERPSHCMRSWKEHLCVVIMNSE